MLYQLDLVIFGRVQGVFFRQETEELARKLSLVGWVRNNANGTVEILAQGEKNKLEELRTWCERGARTGQSRKV